MLIGVEIGGTKLQIAMGDSAGKIVKTVRGKVSLKDGHIGILNWIEENLKGMLSEIKDGNISIEGIGVGFGGPINSAEGTIIKSVQVPGWNDFDLKGWFEKTFSIPTFIYNDSSAAGWGEYVLGSGRGTKEFFYTNMGSGVGGSVVIGGKLFDGQGVGAGELGQVRVADWTADNPGEDQKLEALCSGWAIEQRLRTPGYVPENSVLMAMSEGDAGKITCEMLGRAVKDNDTFACKELDHVARGMGMALADVLCLNQPEKVAVGGGVSLIGEPLMERIRKYTAERVFVSNEGRYEIVQCELGEAIVLEGAILLAAEDLKKQNAC